MAEQFVVPQFLDVESKIIGPITGRQFVILLATILVEFIIYSIFLNVVFMIILGVPVLAVGVIFAFARVNGQPFHYIALNMLQTLRRPGLRVWDKTLTDADIKARITKPKEEVAMTAPSKRSIERSKLSELSLVINTGGVYEPDKDEKVLLDLSDPNSFTLPPQVKEQNKPKN